MIFSKATIETLIIVTIISLFWPKSSHAYLDPGSGSYMIQMLLAATVGFGYVFRNYIKQIKNRFKKHESEKKD